jgi:tryptophan-rich hypothetical protein
MSRKLNPAKLLLSKWTAVKPIDKNKHFLISKIIRPDDPNAPLELFEIEAVYSKKSHQIHWRELQDETKWRQGWISD